MRVFSRLVAGALSCGVLAVFACDQTTYAVQCGAIPRDGCPNRGDACHDKSCARLYTCGADGEWYPVRTCEGFDPDAGAFEGAAPRDASRDVSLDVEGAHGGPGCDDLQIPDCTLALAASCTAGCCGCVDVFVCQGGAWRVWGRCEAGELIED